MRKSSSFALIFIVIFGIGIGVTYAMYNASANVQTVWIGVIAFFVALFVLSQSRLRISGTRR